MRIMNLAAAIWLGLASTIALAQVPAGTGAATAAKPDHASGTGAGLPRSDKASNSGPADTTSIVAPVLPSPPVSNDAMARDYLRAARVALVAGKTGEAQQSLEMAETRALDRPVARGQENLPNASTFIARIADARRVLGNGDVRYAISLIDVALLH
jgi:hypothetical protein